MLRFIIFTMLGDDMGRKKSENPKVPKKRVITSFEIGDLKEPWEKYCKENELSSGAVLGQVISKLTGFRPSLELQRKWKMASVSELDKPEIPYSVVSPGTELDDVLKDVEDPDEIKEALKVLQKHKRVTVMFRLSEFSAIEDCVKRDGFKAPSGWIVTLVRNFMTNQHHFTQVELDVLGESNRQLLAIGRNLNQIAKALNASKKNSDAIYDRELLESLGVAVRAHVKKVGDLMRISAHRWNLRK